MLLLLKIMWGPTQGGWTQRDSQIEQNTGYALANHQLCHYTVLVLN